MPVYLRVSKIYPLHPLRFPYRVILHCLDCLVARLHAGTSLNIQSPAFSLTSLAWRQAMPTFNQNLKIRFLQPLLSLLLLMFNKPPTTGCSPVSWVWPQMSILQHNWHVFAKLNAIRYICIYGQVVSLEQEWNL